MEVSYKRISSMAMDYMLDDRSTTGSTAVLGDVVRRLILDCAGDEGVKSFDEVTARHVKAVMVAMEKEDDGGEARYANTQGEFDNA
jgi:hypothetical protein